MIGNMNAFSICIANHKGGVAKSQTTIEMAYFLSKNRGRVLVVDTDPQANATTLLLGNVAPRGRTLPEILIEGDVIRKDDIMTRSFGFGINVDFVCSSIAAARLEARITASPKEFILADALKDIKENYTHILFDTPPSAELLGMSALLASDAVIIPVTPDKPSIDGVASIIRLVDAIRKNPRLNPDLYVMAILVTRYRMAISTLKGIKILKALYGDMVAEPPIRECTKVQQAVDNNTSIFAFDESCNAAKDYSNCFTSIFKL